MAKKAGQDLAIEPDGDAEAMLVDGLIQVGTDLVWALQSRVGCMDKQTAEAKHCDAVVPCDSAQQSFVRQQPGRLVLDCPAQG